MDKMDEKVGRVAALLEAQRGVAAVDTAEIMGSSNAWRHARQSRIETIVIRAWP